MAMAIAFLITYIAYNIATQPINNLIDICLSEEEKQIKDIISKYSDEIYSVHNFRSRKSGETRYVDFHINVRENLTIKQGPLLCDLIIDDIQKLYPNKKTLIHMEPCTDNCNDCPVKTKYPETCKKVKISTI